MPMEVVLQVEVEAPVERVWEAVATQEGLRGWFNPAISFEPRLGGWVEFAGEHGGSPYRFGGAVVEFAPLRRVTWEWNWVPARWPEPTLLTLELEPLAVSGGTRVTLRHHGWERLPTELRDQTFAGFQRGWDSDDELADLKRYLASAVVV